MDFLKRSVDSLLALLNSTPGHGRDDEHKKVLAFWTTLISILLLPLVLRRLHQRINEPPSPPGAWPIVGHLHLLGKQPHLTIENWAKQLGDVFLLRLGSVPTIVISSPEMAREVLLTQDKTWASRPKRKIAAFHFSYKYRGITFAQYSPMWRQLRKIAMLELLTTKRLEATQSVRVEEAQHMIWSIMQDIAKGKELVDVKLRLNIKLKNEIFRMVLGNRCSGSVRQEEEDGEGPEFEDVIDELQQLNGLFLLGDFVPWLRFLDIGGIEKRMKAVQGRLDTFLSEVLAEHEAQWRKGPIAESDENMVDVLLRIMHEQDSRAPLKVDVECIKATVMDMISASVDTSSVTVEWSMAELIRNPPVLRKLTAELDKVVGKDRLVLEADIPNLKYLQAFVKEVFRLHPPAPLLVPHESIRDCELAGYFVPAGTRLLVHAHALGRSPKAWTHPLRFDPERFLRHPDMDVTGRDFGLLPFGSGRRACPAIALGTVSVQWTTAVLVHAFAWSLPPGQSFLKLDMTKEFGATTLRAHALMLHAAPRLNADLYPLGDDVDLRHFESNSIN